MADQQSPGGFGDESTYAGNSWNLFHQLPHSTQQLVPSTSVTSPTPSVSDISLILMRSTSSALSLSPLPQLRAQRFVATLVVLEIVSYFSASGSAVPVRAHRSRFGRHGHDEARLPGPDVFLASDV